MGLKTWLGLRKPPPRYTRYNGEFDHWFADKDFSADWTSAHFPVWRKHLGPCRGDVASVLEIGSWEGRSAVFFLEFLPNATVTCVDTFEGTKGGLDEALHRQHADASEARFDRNTHAHGNRVRKIKGRSAGVLDRLIADAEAFDLIYIDGDHARDAVLVDSLLAWKLLVPGGTIIWDDYRWMRQAPPETRPQQAIDMFISLHAAELVKLHIGHQMFVRKRPAP